MGLLTAFAVLILTRASPLPVLRGVSWAVLPLVAGLFVLVEAIDRTGWIGLLARHLQQSEKSSELLAAAGAGSIIAVVSNLMNNLPAGLIASTVVIQAHASRRAVDALMIGVDLGPNLSVTGSLATILWLTAIRREGMTVGFLRFLKLGVVVMPPALALAGRLLL